MCGRYRLKDPKRAFDWLEVAPSFDFRPRFNIAPTQKVPVVTGAHQVEEMHWGIVPAWAAGTSKAIINARCETVREKRSFKPSFTLRRCLVPADGFYEWTKIGKRPHFFSLNGGEPFAIGAIWDNGPGMAQCCLLTTAANSVLKPIHNRMPVMIHREDWEEWMEPGSLADESFRRITMPYSAEEVSALEVSPLVNSGRVDDARCCEPAAAVEVNAAPQQIARKEPMIQAEQQTFGF
jgi:putative SOS response-associated peptidase YedK